MTSRISPIDPAEGKAEVLLRGVKSKLGVVPNMMTTMAHSPALLEGYLAFSGALAKGILPAAVREQLALFVSQYNGCEYCLSSHTLFAGRAGLDWRRHGKCRDGEANDRGRSEGD